MREREGDMERERRRGRVCKDEKREEIDTERERLCVQRERETGRGVRGRKR